MSLHLSTHPVVPSQPPEIFVAHQACPAPSVPATPTTGQCWPLPLPPGPAPCPPAAHPSPLSGTPACPRPADSRHGLVDGLHAVAHGELIHNLLGRLVIVNLPSIVPLGVWDLHHAVVLHVRHEVEEVLRPGGEGLSWRTKQASGAPHAIHPVLRSPAYLLFHLCTYPPIYPATPRFALPLIHWVSKSTTYACRCLSIHRSTTHPLSIYHLSTCSCAIYPPSHPPPTICSSKHLSIHLPTPTHPSNYPEIHLSIL